MTAETMGWVIATIALLSAISSPIITAYFNNRYLLKKHDLDFYYSHRSQVIESYLRAVGKYIYSPSHESFAELGVSLSEIFMYTPRDLWPDIEKMNTYIVEYGELRSDYSSDNKEKIEKNKTLLKLHYECLCQSFSDLARPSLFKREESKKNRTNK